MAKKDQQKDGNHEPIVLNFLKKYKLDLIEIPEEFAHVQPDQETRKTRKTPSRKKIL